VLGTRERVSGLVSFVEGAEIFSRASTISSFTSVTSSLILSNNASRSLLSCSSFSTLDRARSMQAEMFNPTFWATESRDFKKQDKRCVCVCVCVRVCVFVCVYVCVCVCACSSLSTSCYVG